MQGSFSYEDLLSLLENIGIKDNSTPNGESFEFVDEDVDEDNNESIDVYTNSRYSEDFWTGARITSQKKDLVDVSQSLILSSKSRSKFISINYRDKEYLPFDDDNLRLSSFYYSTSYDNVESTFIASFFYSIPDQGKINIRYYKTDDDKELSENILLTVTGSGTIIVEPGEEVAELNNGVLTDDSTLTVEGVIDAINQCKIIEILSPIIEKMFPDIYKTLMATMQSKSL